LADASHHERQRFAAPWKRLTSLCRLATGTVAFQVSEVLESNDKGIPAILFRKETSMEDIPGIIRAQGVLTTRGGVSSHAAQDSRKLNKPCVTSYSPKRHLAENTGIFALCSGRAVGLQSMVTPAKCLREEPNAKRKSGMTIQNS